MLNPFTPGGTTKLRATGSTSKIALGLLPGGFGQQVLIQAPAGGPVAFIKFGDSTVAATSADMPVLPGTSRIYSVGNTSYIAGIVGSSSASIYATVGQGQ